jgi:hypothetical protein
MKSEIKKAKLLEKKAKERLYIKMSIYYKFKLTL